MIHRLEFENFFCFRDRQTLDLTVPRSVPDEQDGRLAPVFPGSDLRVPKVIVAFGANGAGKSTVLKALTFLFGFISESFRNERFSITHCLPFNAKESENRPTRLAMEFGGTMMLSREVFRMAYEKPEATSWGTYRYEIVLAPPTRETIARKVLSETLKQRHAGRGKWARVFKRDGRGHVTGSRNFSLSGYAKVVDKLPDYASLIPTLAGFQHEPSQILLDLARQYIFTNISLDKASLPVDELTKLLEAQPGMLEALNAKIRKIDAGVEGVELQSKMDGLVMHFKHSGLAYGMDWSLESTGTQSFILEFPLLYAPIMGGIGISVIDEPDYAVHPLVLMEVLNWYRDPDSDIRVRVQLWMSCQTPTLLDDLAKEEIVFCEKRLDGSAEIFSLADIKGVRRDDNYRKKYLSGIYGAIPQCG